MFGTKANDRDDDDGAEMQLTDDEKDDSDEEEHNVSNVNKRQLYLSIFT